MLLLYKVIPSDFYLPIFIKKSFFYDK